MKITLNSLVKQAFTALLLLTLNTSFFVDNQKFNDIKDFKITFEKSENGIKMISIKGSAWLNLIFKSPADKPQFVDEYGMTTLENATSPKDLNLADYLIKVTKTKNGIFLEGIHGTAWKELTFTLSKNKSQTIDQFGMVE